MVRDQLIEATPEGKDEVTDQLLGENYFLRGMMQFDLLRFCEAVQPCCR